MNRKIGCEYCGSTNVIREPGFAIVQQKSPETGEPIGKENLFFFFKYRSCGEKLYREDLKGSINLLITIILGRLLYAVRILTATVRSRSIPNDRPT